MTPTFDEELDDVEQLLRATQITDSQLQELDESTVVEVDDSEPDTLEVRGHRVRIRPEPDLTRQTIWARSDAHPGVLNLLMLEHFEHSWLEFDPEAIEDAAASLFGPPLQVNLSKIMAVQAAYTKLAPWEDWHVFIHVCSAFNDEPMDPVQFRPPTVEEVGVTVAILNLLDDKPKWSDEMVAFLRTVLVHDQFLEAPAPLQFLNPLPAAPSFNREKVALLRSHPGLISNDESLEGFFASRLHDYDLTQLAMRMRLRKQLRLVRR